MPAYHPCMAKARHHRLIRWYEAIDGPLKGDKMQGPDANGSNPAKPGDLFRWNKIVADRTMIERHEYRVVGPGTDPQAIASTWVRLVSTEPYVAIPSPLPHSTPASTGPGQR